MIAVSRLDGQVAGGRRVGAWPPGGAAQRAPDQAPRLRCLVCLAARACTPARRPLPGRCRALRAGRPLPREAGALTPESLRHSVPRPTALNLATHHITEAILFCCPTTFSFYACRRCASASRSCRAGSGAPWLVASRRSERPRRRASGTARLCGGDCAPGWTTPRSAAAPQAGRRLPTPLCCGSGCGAGRAARPLPRGSSARAAGESALPLPVILGLACSASCGRRDAPATCLQCCSPVHTLPCRVENSVPEQHVLHVRCSRP